MQHLLAASRTTGPVLPFPYEIASHHAHVENKVRSVKSIALLPSHSAKEMRHTLEESAGKA